MNPDTKRKRERRRHKRRHHESDNHAAAHHPPRHDRSRSRRRRRSRTPDRRRRHSRSHSASYRERSSSPRHRRRRRRREDDNDGGSAAYVSDSDNDDKKRAADDKKRGNKWWNGGSWTCGGEYYLPSSSSSSVDSYRGSNRRRRRHSSRDSRDGRRRRGKKSQRSRSRSHSSEYYYTSRDHGGDSGRKRRRGSGKEDKRCGEGRRRRSSGNRSDSSRDDTVGHFQGGPGTYIGEQYRIVRDVGLGTFGRVVECSTRGDNRRVAIKIVRNVRRYYDSALIEADICERVNREQRRQQKDLCAKMLDRFSFHQHYCLVFERLGRSLYDFLKMNDYKPFPMFCVRDFSRQLLEALDFLHGFGLIHTDLKPENILLCYDDRGPQEIPASTKVKVIDFGGATYDNEKKSSIVNTRQYRAPEVILGFPRWSFPSDLWSAGCIIAELYTGHLLFQTHDNAEHLALMEQTCGKFKRDILDRSTSPLARDCFDSRGWHRLKGVLSSRSAEHVRNTKQIERIVSLDDRSTGLTDLLGSLLKLDPMDRDTARQALGRRYFA